MIGKLIEKVKSFFTPESKVHLEGYDVKNRFVQMIQEGDKFYVVVDENGIECSDQKDAELEFEFRLHDANKNF